jgi:hypothetical protein
MQILLILWSRRCPFVNTPQLHCQLNYSTISSQPPLQNSFSTYNSQADGHFSQSSCSSLHRLTVNWLGRKNSKSELLYDWRFTANQFVLASTLWDPRPEISLFFFQLSPCVHSPYATSSLTRRWICLLWICVDFRQVYISRIWNVIEQFLLLHYAQVLCQ